MATSKPRSSKAGRLQPVSEKPIALTLKVDGETYVRLNTLRAKQRRTTQDILAEALKAYLSQARAQSNGNGGI